MLKINDDLKVYLKEELNRGKNEHHIASCKRLGKDTFAWQWIFAFENGYGASIVKHYFSYGFEEDLFELAVITYDEDANDWDITYDTEITEDVIGDLSNEEVMDLLYRIKNLKERQKDENQI